jgi:ParB family transcriptional regulator, chromosome partitioning protein
MATKKSGLGRGLESLIPTAPSEVGGYTDVAVDQVTANPDQPRSRFDDESLEELAASIREIGVLQPIVVQQGDSGYTLIAGERRWRAAKRAGLATIPAVVRETSGNHTLVEALVENVQRSDLTPIEEAKAFQQLLENYGMTQEGIAKRVGKSRPTVSNTLRLLQLPESVQQMVEEQKLTGGHVRALVSIEDEKYAAYLAQKAVDEGWSVRQIEEAARLRRDIESGKPAAEKAVRAIRPVEIIELENRLTEKLSAAVKINYRNRKGKVEIKFASVEELERLYRTMIN